MKFQSGSSGNPSGRPKGTGCRQKLFNDLVEPHKEALFDTAIKLALDGNESMLRLFLERMLPAKPVDDIVVMDMPATGLDKAQGVSICGQDVMMAVSLGKITPAQAESLMSILDVQRKNIETSDLALRLIEIERALKQRKKEK